jgi:hypothetical protein
VPLYLRHGPENDVHRFPGFPTMFGYDKAVYSMDSRRQENRTPSGLFRPDPTQELVLAAVQTHKGADGTAETGSSAWKAPNLVRFGFYLVFRFFIRDQGDIERTTNVLGGDQREAESREPFCFRKCGDGVVARLRGAPSWSKTRAGLIQAWFRTALPSSTADSVLTRPDGYGETVACRSKGGFGTFAVRPA